MPLQNHSTDGATLRARLNELPALIEAANATGNKEASQILRTERAHLEEVVPILEAESKTRACQELKAEIALCERNLLAAEAAFDQATQASNAAREQFLTQGDSRNRSLDLDKHKATARMYAARNALEAQRLALAGLKAAFEENCSAENSGS